MTVKAVVPGSFDPLHNGHLDVVERAAVQFDEVIVAVLVNPSKQGMFTVDERVELIEAATTDLVNVSVESFSGLLVDYCRDRDITLVCKGVRDASDFAYEQQMAQMNQRIGGVETVFMSTSPGWSFVSSSLLKEVARWGGTVSDAVPPVVADALARKTGQA